MRITVVGGSGLVGAKLVSTLRHRGHDVIAASRRSGVNTLTGVGLAEAVEGSRVVVESLHCSRNEDDMATRCTHLDAVRTDQPSTDGCEECLRSGDTWVHLRLCRTCGHVGCCDDSKNRHARKHFQATTHPIITSIEPGESWSWCFVDEAFLKSV